MSLGLSTSEQSARETLQGVNGRCVLLFQVTSFLAIFFALRCESEILRLIFSFMCVVVLRLVFLRILGILGYGGGVGVRVLKQQCFREQSPLKKKLGPSARFQIQERGPGPTRSRSGSPRTTTSRPTFAAPPVTTLPTH